MGYGSIAANVSTGHGTSNRKDVTLVTALRHACASWYHRLLCEHRRSPSKRVAASHHALCQHQPSPSTQCVSTGYRSAHETQHALRVTTTRVLAAHQTLPRKARHRHSTLPHLLASIPSRAAYTRPGRPSVMNRCCQTPQALTSAAGPFRVSVSTALRSSKRMLGGRRRTWISGPRVRVRDTSEPAACEQSFVFLVIDFGEHSAQPEPRTASTFTRSFPISISSPTNSPAVSLTLILVWIEVMSSAIV